MTLEGLKNWTLSEYNEDTDEQMDYYINESKCKKGDKAYLYFHKDNELIDMEIINIIKRTDDIEFYDKEIENDDVLIGGEIYYNADTSAEFITDNDSYLVWFKYVNKGNVIS